MAEDGGWHARGGVPALQRQQVQEAPLFKAVPLDQRNVGWTRWSVWDAQCKWTWGGVGW